MTNIVVSIITVCYNKSDCIEMTINSILSQDYNDYEYIIIDGNSTDETIEITEKYKSLFEKRKIQFTVVSEQDKGIYDAMNKGIVLASGTWINFMNAGDQLYDPNVLSRVFNENFKLIDFVLIYGYKFKNGRPNYPLPTQILKRGIIMANHQSMFFNREKLKDDTFYDIKYPIYGDFELVNRLFLKYGASKFKYLNLPIAIYQGGGISEKQSSQKRKDKFLILYKYYGLMGVLKGLWYKINTDIIK